MPWYTKPCLDEIATWDLKGKKVFEYGMGASSLWWAAKGAIVRGVDSDEDYCAVLWEHEYSLNNKIGAAYFTNPKEYVNHIYVIGKESDIVIIDGIERDECVAPSLECLKPGGILLIDNWNQPSVWIANEENQKILLSLEHKVWKQKGHDDWQTVIFYKQ